MPTVTFNNESYSCTTALKGPDYIHLLNEDGDMIAAFDGIVSFTDFSISDGDWTSPTADNDCRITVTRDDGTHGTSSYTIADIRNNTTYTLTKSGSTITLTGSDGSSTSVTDADTNTTYSLSSFGITATAAELNKLDGVTATATELNYMDGVTSAVQTQLNGKAASSHNHSASNITSGTLAVARGGTGQTSGNAALKAFFAAGNTVLSSYQYGTSLPSAGTAGRVFFLKA